MSSPFVRCSLLRDYKRHKQTSTNKKKFDLLANMETYLMGPLSTSSSNKSNYDRNSSVNRESGSVGSVRGGISSGGSDSISDDLNDSSYDQDLQCDFFDTCVINNNLNPRWRKGLHPDLKNNNFGTFKVPFFPFFFFFSFFFFFAIEIK